MSDTTTEGFNLRDRVFFWMTEARGRGEDTVSVHVERLGEIHDALSGVWQENPGGNPKVMFTDSARNDTCINDIALALDRLNLNLQADGTLAGLLIRLIVQLERVSGRLA